MQYHLKRQWHHLIGKVLENSLPYAAGLLLVLAVKQYFSKAGADELGWMLAAVARLVQLFSGIHFDYESHIGFVNLSERVIIAPACSGINFLIICFAALFFPNVSRFPGSAKLIWLGISGFLAYFVTIGTNTVRIILSIYLYRADIYGNWVTPERVHRLAGTLTYLSALLVTYLVTERVLDRLFSNKKNVDVKPSPSASRLWIPFIFYGLITLLVPLVNGALGHSGSHFLEHAAFVLAVTLPFFLLWVIITKGREKNIDLLTETTEKERSINCN